MSKTKGVDCFPYVPISELNRIVLAWVLFVKVASGYALLMEHDIKVLLILNFFLGIFTICSKTVVGQCVLTIPTLIAGSWFTGGQEWKKQAIPGV